jgi:hypothetical protein
VVPPPWPFPWWIEAGAESNFFHGSLNQAIVGPASKKAERDELSLQSIAYPVGILILSMAPNYFRYMAGYGKKALHFS